MQVLCSNIDKGAELASATVPWHWLIFCLASKLCYKNLPRNFSISLEALKWHWLILASIGALGDSNYKCPDTRTLTKATELYRNVKVQSKIISSVHITLLVFAIFENRLPLFINFTYNFHIKIDLIGTALPSTTYYTQRYSNLASGS